jgi:signal transduction histidine kinase
MDGTKHAQGNRWADEIQDGTMQSLAALRLQLAVGLRDPEALQGAAASAVAQIDDEIAGLRELLAKMRAAT